MLRVRDANAAAGAYSPDPVSVGRRALRNLCLDYLIAPGSAAAIATAVEQMNSADNMTDQIAALGLLAATGCPEREAALARFFEQWQLAALVVDKWFTAQAASPLTDAAAVYALTRHPAFDIRNPNKVRAVIGAFARMNPLHFHALDGSGYRFLAEQVLTIDAMNPQIAARLAGAFNLWKKFDASRQELIRQQFARIGDATGLSRDTREIVTRALGA